MRGSVTNIAWNTVRSRLVWHCDPTPRSGMVPPLLKPGCCSNITRWHGLYRG